MRIEVPAPRRAIELKMDDGAIIRIRQYGNTGGPRLALSHGNGLAIDGYSPFWERLRERYELILFDFRNHGQNPLHDLAHHNWPQFIHDLEPIFHAVGETFGVKRTAGAFHSLSAVTAVMHTQRMGKRWDPLVLFDPPFYPPDGHPLRELQRGNEDDIAARAERRTPSYKDPSDLARQFRRRFTHWQPEAYELMARATLRHDPGSGQWVLACPREYEAHVFRSNRETSTWKRLSEMPVAVKLICADPADGGPPALIGRTLAAEVPVEYEAIAGTSHFLQIEEPVACTRAMETFLAKTGFIS
ncbi:MAG TPA: alpha/beta hydrolase [Candidatus Binataceae bacterium]|nr:alpha/beta hydrolase [Candidatus Binataceae bacterium]